MRGTRFDAIAAIQAAAVAAIAALVTVSRPDLALIAVAAAVIGTGLLGLASRSTLGWSLLGLAYSALPAWCLVWLRSDDTWGATALLYLFAVAWTTDTASYVGGRLIGGPKLAPEHLAAQDLERVYVGALAPALVGLASPLPSRALRPWHLALVSVALALGLPDRET